MRTPAGQAVRAAILLALGLATLAVVSQTVPDVDLWGHVTFGRDIVESGIIRQPDVYSFTDDKEWINHEWLFEVAMATSYSALGPAGLILLRWTMVAALCWLVWNNARRQGASRESAILLVSIVALLTFTRTQHVRPQLASVVAFAAALSLLERASAGRLPAVMAIPPLMLVWANSHGGWLVGGGALGLWSAAQTLFGPSRRLGLIVGASAAAGLLATVVNPYGIGLWEFLGSTVGFGRPDITEWAPVTRAGWGMLAVWSVTAALAARAALRGFVPATADRLLLLALAAASFRVSRLDAFFVIAAAMRCSAGSFVPGARAEGPADTPRMSVTARVAAGVAVAILLATLAPRRLACLDMAGASWLPEPAAAGYARAAQLRGRLFTYFDWGEYAIWHLFPRLQVSMDGRRETVYSMRQVEGHLKAYDSQPGGMDYVRHVAPDYVWLPRSSPVLAALRSEGWTVRWAGPRSTLLARAGASPAAISTPQEPSRETGGRCFPGP